MFKMNYTLIAVFSLLVLANTKAEKICLDINNGKYLGLDNANELPILATSIDKAVDCVITDVLNLSQRPTLPVVNGAQPIQLAGGPSILVNTIQLSSNQKYLAYDSRKSILYFTPDKTIESMWIATHTDGTRTATTFIPLSGIHPSTKETSLLQKLK